MLDRTREHNLIIARRVSSSPPSKREDRSGEEQECPDHPGTDLITEVITKPTPGDVPEIPADSPEEAVAALAVDLDSRAGGQGREQRSDPENGPEQGPEQDPRDGGGGEQTHPVPPLGRHDRDQDNQSIEVGHRRFDEQAGGCQGEGEVSPAARLERQCVDEKRLLQDVNQNEC